MGLRQAPSSSGARRKIILGGKIGQYFKRLFDLFSPLLPEFQLTSGIWNQKMYKFYGGVQRLAVVIVSRSASVPTHGLLLYLRMPA
jgi:hypothetical protein